MSEHRVKEHKVSLPSMREFKKFDYDNMATQKDIVYSNPQFLPPGFGESEVMNDKPDERNSPYDHSIDDYPQCNDQPIDYYDHNDQPADQHHGQNDQPDIHHDVDQLHQDIVVEKRPTDEKKQIVPKAEDSVENQQKTKATKRQKEPLRIIDDNAAHEDKIHPKQKLATSTRAQSKKRGPDAQPTGRNKTTENNRKKPKKEKVTVDEERAFNKVEKAKSELISHKSGPNNTRADFQRPTQPKNIATAHQTPASFSRRVSADTENRRATNRPPSLSEVEGRSRERGPASH